MICRRIFGLFALASIAACSNGSGDVGEVGERAQTARQEVLGSNPVTVPGTTKADFKVNEHGALTYTIPIVVPPGSAGMEPGISLLYSSQGGNGIAGYGWSVTGLSAIGRCPQNTAQDGAIVPVNYDINDRFCLDGQRLVLVSSSTGSWEYRQEQEGFSRIRAQGGTQDNPSHWEVKTRAGQTLLFGTSPTSRIEAQGSATAARVWALERVVDAKGNYLTVSYTESNATGEFYPTRIDYTGNDNVPGQIADKQSVRFAYETRTDQTSGFVAGDAVKNTVRLTHIRTYADQSSLVREYRLAYQPGVSRSRLASVQECNPDGASGSCYRALSFTYANGGNTLAAASNWNASLSATARVGDFNGDGAMDLFDVSAGTATVALSGRTSFLAPTTWGNGLVTDRDAIFAADLNGDGKSDLFQFEPSANITARLSTGTSFGPPVPWGTGIGSDPKQMHVADFDGDGRVDVLRADSISGDTFLSRGTGTTFQTPVLWTCCTGGAPDWLRTGDFDGDGREDLLSLMNGDQVHVWTSSGTAATARGAWATGHANARSEFRVADVNGDGKSDLVRLAATGTASVWISTGKAFLPPVAWGAGVTANDQLSDINGDGRADILQVDGSLNLKVAPSSGAAFGAWFTWGALKTPATTSINIALPPGVTGVPCGDTAALETECKSQGYGSYAGGSNHTCANVQTGTQCSSPSASGGNSSTNGIQSITVVNPTTLRITTKSAQYSSSTTRDLTLGGLATFSGQGCSTGVNSISYAANRLTLNCGGTSQYTQASTAYVYINNVSIPQTSGTAGGTQVTNINGSGNTISFTGYLATYNGGQQARNFSLTLNSTCWPTYTSYVNTAKCVQAFGAQFGDFDADGKVDAVALLSPSGGAFVNRETSSAFGDLMTDVTDGFGNIRQVEYGTLLDPAVYTKDADAVYPVQDVSSGMAVVKTVRESDGLGGLKSTTFTYKGAKVDGSGRGFLGFREMAYATARANGAVTKTESTYLQSHPFVGNLSSVKRYVGSTLMSSTVSTYEARPFLLTGQPTRHFVYTKSTVTSGTDLSGTALPTTVTTNTYDTEPSDTETWGNLKTTVTSVGGVTTTTRNTFLPADVTNWRLGRLSRAEVESAQGGVSIKRVSSFEYDTSTGLLTKETIEPDTAALRLVTTYTYDAWGHKASSNVSGVDIAPRTTVSTYDAQGRFAVQTKNATNRTTVIEYDTRHGTVTATTDPNGIVTRATFDGFGRKTSETRPDGVVSTIEYANTSAPYSVVTRTPGAPTSTVHADSLGRETRKIVIGFDGREVYQDTIYSADGEVWKKSSPYFQGTTPQWSELRYDNAGRLVSTTFPDASVQTVAYDALREAITNPKGQVTTRVKNAQGKVTSVTDARGGVITHQYDAVGNLVQTTDPAGNVTRITYDARGRKVSLDDPDLGLVTYAYNVADETIEQVSPVLRGQAKKIAWTYDVLGRVLTRDDAGVVSTFTYDTCTTGIGKLCVASSPGYSKTLSYDSFGRVSSEVVVIDGVSYATSTTFDAQGRVDKITYPSGLVVQNQYNTNGYLWRVVDFTAGIVGTAYWTGNTMSALGQFTQETLGNALVTSRTYDPNTNALLTVKTGTTGVPTSTQNLTFTYDSVGNVTSRADTVNGLSESFTYDEVNRLLTAAPTVFRGAAVSGTPPAGAPSALTLAYDAIGNITSKSDVGAYTYGALPAGRTGILPHAVSAIPGRVYTFDANGNVTRYTMGSAQRDVTWTAFDMPIKFTHKDTPSSAVTLSTEFSYGADRQRIKQVSTTGATTETTYSVSPLYEKVVKGSDTQHRSYVFACGAIVSVQTKKNAGTETRYLHRDHLGSVAAITNEAGGLVERFSYDPYGVRRAADGSALTNPTLVSGITRGYTGHEMLDTFGLVHMNGRIQDPLLGRFLSADPFIEDNERSQALNRYSYVSNNPLTYTDPTGFFSLKKFFKKHFRWVVAVVAIVAAIYFGPAALAALKGALGVFWGTVAAGALGGAVVGYVFGGTLKSALMGALSGAVFGFVGNVTQGMYIGKAIAHGLAGGALSELQGGSFTSGFLSGAFGALASPIVAGMSAQVAQNAILQACAGAAAAAVIGGVGSVLGGGKFENGALTAAYGYLFNHGLHRQTETVKGPLLPGKSWARLWGMRTDVQEALQSADVTVASGHSNYNAVGGFDAGDMPASVHSRVFIAAGCNTSVLAAGANTLAGAFLRAQPEGAFVGTTGDISNGTQDAAPVRIIESMRSNPTMTLNEAVRIENSRIQYHNGWNAGSWRVQGNGDLTWSTITHQ